MKKETFDEWIKGRTCKSCDIFDSNTFCFILEPSNQGPDDRCYYLVHRIKEENEDGKPQDFGVKFEHDSQFKTAANPNMPELVITALGGNIFYHVGSKGGNENLLSRNEIQAVTQVKYIGNNFYVTGLNRAVLRRDGVNKWTHISCELGNEKLDISDIGFYDIDGFNEKDIYAVGGDGDTWHYNGKEWTQIDIPINVSLYSVCCASDGNVYIGGTSHTIVKGRGDIWEVINHKFTNDRFKQIVDYNGRLLAVDEWGINLFEIKHDGVTNMDIGDFDLYGGDCFCLAVGHGMLLVAGSESAAVFDGNKWYQLFSSAQAVSDEELLKGLLYSTKQGLDDLKDALEDLDE